MTAELLLHDPAEVGMSSERLELAGALMERQFAEGRSPMLAAVVARHGKVVFAKALGDQRPGGPPLTIDSVFPMASLAKPMTAAVVMALAERGMVGLHEPAALTLPELAGDHDDVLVAHLLTHTSGWAAEDMAAALAADAEDAPAPALGGVDALTHRFLSVGLTVPRRRGVSEMMDYSNFNYTLLGEMVRRVTGGSLDAAVRRYLFEPAGMTRSRYVMTDELRPYLIERPPGIPFGPGHPDTPISQNDALWEECDDGSMGAYASARDLQGFFQMVLDGGRVGDQVVLSPAAVRAMTTDRAPDIPTGAMGQTHRVASWGFGFAVHAGERWKQFGGGTVAPGSVAHGGAGGIGGWADRHHGIAASYVEVITEADEFNVPLSWAANRFEDVVTSAIEP